MTALIRFGLCLVLIINFSGCTTVPILNPAKIESPLGLYKSNSAEKYWLAIMQSEQYLLCSPDECHKGAYQNVPAKYGVILLDFFVSNLGQDIERQSHKANNTEAFFQAMNALRLAEPRPNDLAFYVSDCQGTPCAGVGHRRSGIKFYKIEDF